MKIIKKGFLIIIEFLFCATYCYYNVDSKNYLILSVAVVTLTEILLLFLSKKSKRKDD